MAMAGEVLRHVTKKACTILYPFEKHQVFMPKGFRGKQKFDIEKCTGCTLCARDCPSGAITMVECSKEVTKAGKRPIFDLGLCLFCGQCEESCKFDAVKMTEEYELAGFEKSNMIIDIC